MSTSRKRLTSSILPLVIVACSFLFSLLSSPVHAYPLKYVDAEDNIVVLEKRQATQPSSATYLDDEYYVYNGLTTTAALTGTIFVIIGIYLGTFGYRGIERKITVGVTGLLLFAAATYIALVNAEPSWGYSAPNHIMFTAVPFGIGILGAAIFVLFSHLAVHFIGGLAGFLLIIYVLAFQDNHIITNSIARYCTLFGAFILGTVAGVVGGSYVFLFATSFMGAYFFMFGLDLFIHVGLVTSVTSLLDQNYQGYNYTLDWQLYTILSVIGFLTLVSYGWQVLVNRRASGGSKAAAKKPAHSDHSGH